MEKKIKQRQRPRYCDRQRHNTIKDRDTHTDTDGQIDIGVDRDTIQVHIEIQKYSKKH